MKKKKNKKWKVEITVSGIESETDDDYADQVQKIEWAIRDLNNSYEVDVGVGEEDDT